MSQYPIVSDEGVLEAVNYLAAGPAGLGQNFSGFSAYQPAWLTGNFRQPYAIAFTATNAPIPWYQNIAISTATSLDVQPNGTSRYVEWTFTTPQSLPPFLVGNQPRGTGFSEDFYNGSQGFVISCSTTSVITQYNNYYTIPPITSTGNLFINNNNTLVSTDANSRVTVTGPTEDVFISSQCAFTVNYDCTTSTQFDIKVSIDRYAGYEDTTTPNSVDYYFLESGVVSEVITRYDNIATTSSGSVETGQIVFTTVQDRPNYGYYWYLLDFMFVTRPTYRYLSNGDIAYGELYNATASGTCINTSTTVSFTGVSLVNVSSSGSSGLADVTIYNTNTYTTLYEYNASVSVYGGSNYAVGDTLKILGTDLGGISPDNDMSLTVSQVAYPGAGNITVDNVSVGLRTMTTQVIKR